MCDEVLVELMPADFLLWRCLHGGPLTRDNLEGCGPDPQVDWPAARARNVPLLQRLTEVYGACAVVAREAERIVGTLRFYPKAVWTLARSEGFCLQQPFPSGPPQDLAERDLRPLDELEDRTLAVHCLAVGRPGARDDPRRRKGLGSRMVRTLIDWARPRGWTAIEATTHVDLDLLYDISGTAGRQFWERLGFREVRTDVEAVLQEESELLEALRREAAERGIPPDRLADRYTLRLELA